MFSYKKSNKESIFSNFINYGLAGFIVLISTISFEFDNVKSFFVQSPVNVIKADAPSALSGKTLEQKQKFYKIFQGIADYSKNADRVRDNKQIRDILVEVYLVYDVQGDTSKSIQPLVDEVFTNSGLKADDSFGPIRQKVGDAFQELANKIKTSIENDPSFKK